MLTTNDSPAEKSRDHGICRQIGPYMPNDTVEIIFGLVGVDLLRVVATGINDKLDGTGLLRNTEYWRVVSPLSDLVGLGKGDALSATATSFAFEGADVLSFLTKLTSAGTLPQASPAWTKGVPTTRSTLHLFQAIDFTAKVENAKLTLMLEVEGGTTLVGIGWHRDIDPSPPLAFEWIDAATLSWTFTCIGTDRGDLGTTGYYVLQRLG